MYDILQGEKMEERYCTNWRYATNEELLLDGWKFKRLPRITNAYKDAYENEKNFNLSNAIKVEGKIMKQEKREKITRKLMTFSKEWIKNFINVNADPKHRKIDTSYVWSETKKERYKEVISLAIGMMQEERMILTRGEFNYECRVMTSKFEEVIKEVYDCIKNNEKKSITPILGKVIKLIELSGCKDAAVEWNKFITILTKEGWNNSMYNVMVDRILKIDKLIRKYGMDAAKYMKCFNDLSKIMFKAAIKIFGSKKANTSVKRGNYVRSKYEILGELEAMLMCYRACFEANIEGVDIHEHFDAHIMKMSELFPSLKGTLQKAKYSRSEFMSIISVINELKRSLKSQITLKASTRKRSRDVAKNVLKRKMKISIEGYENSQFLVVKKNFLEYMRKLETHSVSDQQAENFKNKYSKYVINKTNFSKEFDKKWTLDDWKRLIKKANANSAPSAFDGLPLKLFKVITFSSGYGFIPIFNGWKRAPSEFGLEELKRSWYSKLYKEGLLKLPATFRYVKLAGSPIKLYLALIANDCNKQVVKSSCYRFQGGLDEGKRGCTELIAKNQYMTDYASMNNLSKESLLLDVKKCFKLLQHLIIIAVFAMTEEIGSYYSFKQYKKARTGRVLWQAMNNNVMYVRCVDGVAKHKNKVGMDQGVNLAMTGANLLNGLLANVIQIECAEFALRPFKSDDWSERLYNTSLIETVVLQYVDDTHIVCGNIEGIYKASKICNEFAHDCKSFFNPNKSFLIRTKFTQGGQIPIITSPVKIELLDFDLKKKEVKILREGQSCKFLGVWIGHGNNAGKAIMKFMLKTFSAIGGINGLLLSSRVIHQCMQTLILSKLEYVLGVIPLRCNTVEILQKYVSRAYCKLANLGRNDANILYTPTEHGGYGALKLSCRYIKSLISNVCYLANCSTREIRSDYINDIKDAIKSMNNVIPFVDKIMKRSIVIEGQSIEAWFLSKESSIRWKEEYADYPRFLLFIAAIMSMGLGLYILESDNLMTDETQREHKYVKLVEYLPDNSYRFIAQKNITVVLKQLLYQWQYQKYKNLGSNWKDHVKDSDPAFISIVSGNVDKSSVDVDMILRARNKTLPLRTHNNECINKMCTNGCKKYENLAHIGGFCSYLSQLINNMHNEIEKVLTSFLVGRYVDEVSTIWKKRVCVINDEKIPDMLIDELEWDKYMRDSPTTHTKPDIVIWSYIPNGNEVRIHPLVYVVEVSITDAKYMKTRYEEKVRKYKRLLGCFRKGLDVKFGAIIINE